jgi:hypothetical protein
MGSFGIKLEDINKLLVGKLSDAYRAVTGKNPDPLRVQSRSDEITLVIGELGAQTFAACLGELLYAPHVIAGRYDRTGALRSPYCTIAQRHLRELSWSLWRPGDAPRRLPRDGEALLPGPDIAAP